MPRIGQILEVIVDADTSAAEGKLNKLGDDADGGSGWGRRLASGAVKSFAAVGVAAASVVGLGTKVAIDMEQAKVGFDVMLGSATKADAFLKDLQGFAAKTPFEFPELQTAASRLLAVGVETKSVIPIMTALGDATSGMGTGAEGIQRAVAALQKMNTSGKVSAETMNQLTEAGIPAWDALAAKLGTDVAGAQEKVTAGAVKVGDMMAAIETKAGPGFQRLNGMMDKQSSTLGGMISTLKDTVSMGLAGMAEPIVASLKDTIGPVTEVIGESIKKIGPTLGVVVSGMLDVLKELLPAIMPIVGALGELMGGVFKELAPVIKKLAPSIAVIAENALEVLQAFIPLVPIIGQLAVVAAQLIAAIPVPVLQAIVFALIGFKVVSTITTLFGALNVVVGLFGVTMGVALAPVIAIIAAIAALAAIVYVVIRNWSTITEFFGTLWEGVKAIFSAFVGWITENAATMARVVLAVLTGGFSEVVMFFIRHWDDIKRGVATGVGKVVGFMKELPGKILSALGSLKTLLLDVGKDIIEGLIKGITGAFGKVKDTLGNLTSKIISWKGPPRRDASLLTAAGSSIMAGFIRGLESKYGDVRGSLADLSGSLTASARLSTGYAQASGVGAGGYAQASARTVAAHAGITIIQNIGGSVIAERDLIEKTRDGLIRTGYSNAGGVIGGQG